MMWWNGSWGWAGVVMASMMVPTIWLIVWVVVVRPPYRGNRRLSPLERLDRRLAAGEISPDEYRTVRTVLEHRSPA